MLRSYLVVAGVAVTTLGLSFAAGCGSDAVGPGAGGSGGGGGNPTTGSGTHATPPAPGPTKPGDGTGSVTMAISKLYLGDTKRDGSPDAVNGWKEYGYDLDGVISTATSTGLCKPRDNAS